MLQSIINPSNVISDQYNSIVFSLKNGQSVVGRLVDEDEDTYRISQNPFATEIIRTIPKDQVTEKKYSTISSMPEGMINRLNEDELKDLLAYLVAGGNQDHEIFRDGAGQVRK
jgi:putative heme-binding domain-containing protein